MISSIPQHIPHDDPMMSPLKQCHHQGLEDGDDAVLQERSVEDNYPAHDDLMDDLVLQERSVGVKVDPAAEELEQLEVAVDLQQSPQHHQETQAQQNPSSESGGKLAETAGEDPLSDRSQSIPSPSHLIRAVCTDKPNVNSSNVSESVRSEGAVSGDDRDSPMEQKNDVAEVEHVEESLGIPGRDRSSASMASDPMERGSHSRDANVSGDYSEEFEEGNEDNKLTFSIAVVDVDKNDDENVASNDGPDSPTSPASPAAVSEAPSRDCQHLSVSEAVPSMTSASMEQSQSGEDPFLENLERSRPIHTNSEDQKAYSEDAREELGDEEYSGEWSGEERSVGEALLDHATQSQPAESRGGRGQSGESNYQQDGTHSEDAREELGDGEYSGEWSGEERSVGEALLDHAAQSQPAESRGGRGQSGESNYQQDGTHSEDVKEELGDGDYSGEWSGEERSVGEALLDHATQSQPAESRGGRGQSGESDDQQDGTHSEDVKEELGDGDYSGEWSGEERSVGEALLDHATQSQPAESRGGRGQSGESDYQQDVTHSEDAREELGDGEYSGEWSGEERSVGEALLDHATQSQPAESRGGRGQSGESDDQQDGTHSEDVKEELGDGDYSGEWSGEERSVGEALLDHAAQSQPAESRGGRGQSGESDYQQDGTHSEDVKEELGDGDYSGEWSGEERSVGEALLDHAAQSQPAESRGRGQSGESDYQQDGTHSEDAREELGDGEYSGEWSGEECSVDLQQSPQHHQETQAQQNPSSESGGKLAETAGEDPLSDRSQSIPSPSHLIRAVCTDKPNVNSSNASESVRSEGAVSGDDRDSPMEQKNDVAEVEHVEESLGIPGRDRSSASMASDPMERGSHSRDANVSGDYSEEFEEGNEDNKLTFSIAVVDVDKNDDENVASNDGPDSPTSPASPASPAAVSEAPSRDCQHLSVSEAVPSMTSASMEQSQSGEDPFLENLAGNRHIHADPFLENLAGNQPIPQRETPAEDVKDELGDGEYSGLCLLGMICQQFHLFGSVQTSRNRTCPEWVSCKHHFQIVVGISSSIVQTWDNWLLNCFKIP